jgi:uncharacterized protein
VAPVSLFVSVYLATFIGGGRLAIAIGLPYQQWAALLAGACATIITIRIVEAGRWRIGFLVPPRAAARELLLGIGVAAILIGACDLLVSLFSHVRHARGDGFPWLELLTVFIPAAVHEEVVFRGYPFQKIASWRRGAGYAYSGGVFALLHLFNTGVTWIALLNIALAGVMLALAYERFDRLWLPIGIHFAWNVVSGPILGYPVSAFVAERSLLTTVARGPAWITGGAFGIEGSICIAAVELAAIGIMWRMERT